MAWKKKANLRGPRGVSVRDAAIVESGNLWLETTDGLVLDAGQARGVQGLPGTGAVAADAAVAGYIGTAGSSATKDALLAGFVPQGAVSAIANIAATDFAAELQAKIDAMAEFGGGIVEIPKGTVTFTSTVKLRPGVTVRGRGKTATAITSNGDFPLFASITPLVRIDNVELSNMRIYRIVPAAATTPVVDWTGIAHSELRHVSIEQPSSSRHATTGVLFGAWSYYNKVDMVQVRGVHEGFKFVGEANGNNITNCSVLTSNYGYVVDNTNSLLFLGSAAEHVDMVAFLLRNKSKKNRIIGCRAEDIPVCYQVLGGATQSFDNFIIANLAYERAGGTRYDIQTSNLLIEEATQRYLNYLARTHLEARKSFGQGTTSALAKVLFEAEDVDQLAEFTGSTFTTFAAGLYQVGASASWTSVAAGTRLELFIYKNGVLDVRLSDVYAASAAVQTTTGSVSMRLAAGDKIEIWARSSVASAIIVSPSDTYLRITRIA